jgi:hypothetical protein
MAKQRSGLRPSRLASWQLVEATSAGFEGPAACRVNGPSVSVRSRLRGNLSIQIFPSGFVSIAELMEK